MINENEIAVNKAAESMGDKQESTVSTTSVEDTATTSVKDDEKVNNEKPKRPGRKKRNSSATLDTTDENPDNLPKNDTQPLFEQPIIVEGKRSRKPTSRLELTELMTPKKELSIPEGHGKPLGEIEYINYQITHAPHDVLSRLRNVCFGRRTSQIDIRQNLREFKGFEFEHNSDEYQRHLSSLIKFKRDQLRSISDILGLSTTGRHNEHAERILNFLLQPIDDGKKIPERKMSMRNTSKTSSTNSKYINYAEDDDDNDFEDRIENGDPDDLFFDDDEADAETDDDYIGSDDESGLNSRDDPDDFVYQPGKKIVKKRSPSKRSRKGTGNKRKQDGRSATSKRGRKKAKTTATETTENENTDVPTDLAQTKDEGNKAPNENNLTIEIPSAEVKNNNLKSTDANPSEQTNAFKNNSITETIPN